MHMIRADSTEACKCMFDGVIREEGLRRVMQSARVGRINIPWAFGPFLAQTELAVTAQTGLVVVDWSAGPMVDAA